MARSSNATVVNASPNWTQLFDAANDGGRPPREITVKNLSSSAANVEVYMTNDPSVSAVPGGVTGIVLAPGETQSFASFAPGGGNIQRLWARSTNATVSFGITID